MSDDDALVERVKLVEQLGKERLGAQTWQTYVNAIGTNPNVAANDIARAALATDDPVRAIEEAGRHCLVNAASAAAANGNFDSPEEREYSRIRTEERRAFRERRGKIY